MTVLSSPRQSPLLSPRIWRSPKSEFSGDECRDAASVYTDAELEAIRSQGFDAIWLRGKLRSLMRSRVLPELNEPEAGERIESLRTVIERGREAGVGVYLFFNEPLSVPADHPFWTSHPELKGQPHHEAGYGGDKYALCTSTPTVQRFLEQATQDLMQDLPGLEGLILITATEFHTHCWSHYGRYSLNDGYVAAKKEPMACPRCRDREPAEIVTELIDVWRRAADSVTPRPRVLAWNWSWSIWYPDPQREVIDRLPQGVELMADWERGGTMPWRGRELSVDEYSMSFTGPSERFTQSQAIAEEMGLPMHAKLQLGTTHELATVPNLPLMSNFHTKMVGMKRRGVRGLMGTWNFGCSRTLNTFAFGLFWSDPERYMDRERFLTELAQRYFGMDEVSGVIEGWEAFKAAFAHYPFSIRFLYSSPMNYAPALSLDLHYRAAPLGPTWRTHKFGDRFEDCLGDVFTLDEVIDASEAMSAEWSRGLASYRAALEAGASPEAAEQRAEELRCAAMIDSQLRSFFHVAKFHRWRQRRMAAQGLEAPCTVTADAEALDLMRTELDNARAALPLTEADPRLGYHQECQAYFYNAPAIREKIAHLEGQLGAAE